jgi:glycosyltransferase involved in cell wall biosynthesis/predicted O-methyltransferase YrrM
MQKTIEETMDSYPYEKGGITLIEAKALSQYAGRVTTGVILEIGSYKGKSALALAHGVNASQSENLPQIYCVDPHKSFVGELGGVFGPEDRKDFFQLMLDSEVYKNISLINVESTVLIRGWNKPIGMLFIDGDHRYGSVRDDYESWYPHVIDGGIIALDDSKPLLGQSLGSAEFTQELIGNGFEPIETVGKITFFRKPCTKISTTKNISIRTLLVYAEENIVSGGLIRFVRLGHMLRNRGVEVSFCFENHSGRWHPECFEVLSPEEAFKRNWGATLIPGAGFSDSFIDSLQTLSGEQFGFRIQAVLNDRSCREKFIAVNRAFKPTSVFFNNADWFEGSYTDFLAKKFHVIEGAVDSSQFYPCITSKSNTEFVIGISSKSIERMLPVMQKLKGNEVLHVMGKISHLIKKSHSFQQLFNSKKIVEVGQLNENELVDFYHKCHCVVHVESFAGWANTAAEAMACGIPLVCTSAGTSSFSKNKVTALVLDAYSTNACVSAIENISTNYDKALLRAQAGRKEILKYGWDKFCDDFMALLFDDGREHYLRLPELNMYGKWPVSTRTEVLPFLEGFVKEASVFDAGCAEGYIAHRLLNAGCSRLDGVELDGGRVLTARALSVNDPRATFIHGSVAPWRDFQEKFGETLLDKYDVVLYLAVHQHLPKAERIPTLIGLLNLAANSFVMRVPATFYDDGELVETISNLGFRLYSEHLTGHHGGAGPIRFYRREEQLCPEN